MSSRRVILGIALSFGFGIVESEAMAQVCCIVNFDQDAMGAGDVGVAIAPSTNTPFQKTFALDDKDDKVRDDIRDFINADPTLQAVDVGDTTIVVSRTDGEDITSCTSINNDGHTIVGIHLIQTLFVVADFDPKDTTDDTETAATETRGSNNVVSVTIDGVTKQLVNVDTDKERARRELKECLEAYYGGTGFSGDMGEHLVVGTPQEIAQAVKAFGEAGAQTVALSLPWPDVAKLEWLAAEVMPALE